MVRRFDIVLKRGRWESKARTAIAWPGDSVCVAPVGGHMQLAIRSEQTPGRRQHRMSSNLNVLGLAGLFATSLAHAATALTKFGALATVSSFTCPGDNCGGGTLNDAIPLRTTLQVGPIDGAAGAISANVAATLTDQPGGADPLSAYSLLTTLALASPADNFLEFNASGAVQTTGMVSIDVTDGAQFYLVMGLMRAPAVPVRPRCRWAP